ncbi:unnamed protein product [Paramecium pentaurelia]|uniref:Uncharacterized protein n=1 Tax=Paramecium pentaurelia TaxID=43138 RepID=A0A8S1Y5Y3_9CILI|nr:unnamed protein product [Paramecium pentaurelia]
MHSLSLYKHKQDMEIQRAHQYEQSLKAKELQKSQLLYKSCERLQMLSDRQMQKLRLSQISVFKHEQNHQRFKSQESEAIHTRPKIELGKEAYDKWILMQKRLISKEETQKLKKYESKIQKAHEIGMLKENELLNKQKLRIQTQLIKESIHNEQQLKLQKIQKKEYAKLHLI